MKEAGKSGPIKGTIKFFDKLEDRVRAKLSKRPIIYSLVGGVAIVLFWRGVWMVADQYEFMTGWVSIILSVVVLLMTGLFASFFVGDQILLSGLKKEKKLIEKTEGEIEQESTTLTDVKDELEKIEEKLDKIKNRR